MFQLLARDNGFVHVCGHRGHSIAAPENTLAALTATRDNGGTSAEIDCMLTADGEIVLMHDDFLDRTTDGSGLVSKATLERDPRLDAGSWFDAALRRRARADAQRGAPRTPTRSASAWSSRSRSSSTSIAWSTRLAEIVAETGGADHAIFISFDHTFLQVAEGASPRHPHRGHHPCPPRRHRRASRSRPTSIRFRSST